MSDLLKWHLRDRCLVCNEEVEFQDHGVHVATSIGSEALACSVHTECLRDLACDHDLTSRQANGTGWLCIICGEPSDRGRGIAILTEFGRLGEGRTDRAPNYVAHADCARKHAHPEYVVVVLNPRR